MKLSVKKINNEAVLPTRAHSYDAGMDLYVNGRQVITAHTTIVVPTGISMEIPEGFVGLIWDKSSIGTKGLKTLGGVVDSEYRGEVKVVVHNLNNEDIIFEHGQKIAQMLIQKVELVDIEEVADLSSTVRGEGGFGSTGR
ncbi:MAG: dUTP diphosphatase [Candidatus Nomurabacteria bacterium]|nr:dUTP diphosphatase [Candidatus Nomurabacteria bacterium]